MSRLLPRVQLNFTHYVIALPRDWLRWSAFSRTFKAEIESRQQCCADVLCTCGGCYQVLVRRRNLSLERAIAMQRFVRFDCALPPKKRQRKNKPPHLGFAEEVVAATTTTTTTASLTLLNLPNELLFNILLEVCVSRLHFRLHDVASLASACRRLFDIAKTPLLWRRVTERLHSYIAQPSAGINAAHAFFNGGSCMRLPWKCAMVPPRFGVVLQENGVGSITHIVRDPRAPDTIVEYTRASDRHSRTFRRYAISQFGWRLGVGVQFTHFFIDVTYVQQVSADVAWQNARFELTAYPAQFAGSTKGEARRIFFMQFTHQLSANSTLLLGLQ